VKEAEWDWTRRFELLVYAGEHAVNGTCYIICETLNHLPSGLFATSPNNVAQNDWNRLS